MCAPTLTYRLPLQLHFGLKEHRRDEDISLLLAHSSMHRHAIHLARCNSLPLADVTLVKNGQAKRAFNPIVPNASRKANIEI